MTDFLTRDEVVAIFGEEVIAQLDGENCEYSAQRSNGAWQEWTSTVFTPAHNEYHGVQAHFFVTAEELDAAGDDLSNVNWDDAIEGYSILD